MKKDLCTKCGFLSWSVSHVLDERGETIRHSEIGDFWRKRLSIGTDPGISEDTEAQEEYRASCLREQWVFTRNARQDKEIRYADLKSLAVPRQCPYFFKYQPGFSPVEHKEIQREAETRNTTFRATIWGAIIGATAAILAQVLYAVITKWLLK